MADEAERPDDVSADVADTRSELPPGWSNAGSLEDPDSGTCTHYVRRNGLKLCDTYVLAFGDGTVCVDDPHDDIGLAELHAVLSHHLATGGRQS